MLYAFFSGVLVAGFLVAALFFLRFWSRSNDPLFLSFACSFLLLGLGQSLLALGGFAVEERSWVYLIRLTAFLLILAAVYGKNRTRRSR